MTPVNKLIDTYVALASLAYNIQKPRVEPAVPTICYILLNESVPKA